MSAHRSPQPPAPPRQPGASDAGERQFGADHGTDVPFPLFRARLVECRKARGLTQHQLADASHLHPGHIARIEAGFDENPTMRTVGTLAEALGVAPAYLLGVDALTVMPRATGTGRGDSRLGDAITFHGEAR